MKKLNKIRIWFALSLPSAWLISWLIWFIRPEIDLFTAIMFARVGLPIFPIGLPALFIWNENILQRHMVLFVVSGYTVYATLIIWGLIRPYRFVLFVLCLLLLANIAGCQLEHMLDAFGP